MNRFAGLTFTAFVTFLATVTALGRYGIGGRDLIPAFLAPFAAALVGALLYLLFSLYREHRQLLAMENFFKWRLTKEKKQELVDEWLCHLATDVARSEQRWKELHQDGVGALYGVEVVRTFVNREYRLRQDFKASESDFNRNLKSIEKFIKRFKGLELRGWNWRTYLTQQTEEVEVKQEKQPQTQ